MKHRTMILIGGAAVLGFLYIRSRAAATAPAVVNAGTAAPVGNTATEAAGTSNSQTVTGSEAAYTSGVTKPLKLPALGAMETTVREMYDALLASMATASAGTAVNSETGTGPA